MIVVSVDNAKVQAALKKLTAKVQNLTPVLTRIGLFYERNVKRNFEKQSSPDNNAWKPLAPATLARKKKRKKTNRILIQDSDLIGAIHAQADNNSVTIGVGDHVKYGAIHQFGGPAGRKDKQFTMPARPFLAENADNNSLQLGKADQQMILDELTDELENATRP